MDQTLLMLHLFPLSGDRQQPRPGNTPQPGLLRGHLAPPGHGEGEEAEGDAAA